MWGSVYDKTGVSEKACPRCKAVGSVQLYWLAARWRAFLGLAVVGFTIGRWLDNSFARKEIYAVVSSVLVLLALVIGFRATCRACGARLVRGAFGGWV
jgi:hypothetical protein